MNRTTATAKINNPKPRVIFLEMVSLKFIKCE